MGEERGDGHRMAAQEEMNAATNSGMAEGAPARRPSRGEQARAAAAALAVVAADQATKCAARSLLLPGRPVEVIPGFFNLTLVFNRGAAWGMLPGFRIFFVALAAGMLAFLGLSFRRGRLFSEGLLSRVAGSLLAGGVCGNAIDRALTGEVTDFIDLWHASYHFPCFNVADSAICIGIALYFLATLRAPRQ